MADPEANSLQLLNEVGKVLDQEGVRWAAIGALAVAYHGVVRASLDADAIITFKGSTSDLNRLGDALREKGWKIDIRKGEAGDPLGYVVRIQDTAENQVDLIGGISRMDPALFDRSFPDQLEGFDLKMVSAEDLVALKIFAGSAQDLADAASVVAVQGETLDRDLALALCRGFGPEEEKRAKQLLKS